MVNWMTQHEALLNVILNFGMLLIWLVYAQLLFIGFRRERRPRLLINRGKRRDVDALCIISNMSAEAVYIEYIIAELETSHGTVSLNVTEYEQEYPDEDEAEDQSQRQPPPVPNAVRENTRQGPLASGEFIHIGTFEQIIKRAAHSARIEMRGHQPVAEIEFQRLTIQLIVLYGSEDKPISATRSFNICRSESDTEPMWLSPTTWDTIRGSSFSHRQRLCAQLERMNRIDFSSTSTISGLDGEPHDE